MRVGTVTEVKEEILDKFYKGWHYLGMKPIRLQTSIEIWTEIEATLTGGERFQEFGHDYWRTSYGNVDVLITQRRGAYYQITFEAK